MGDSRLGSRSTPHHTVHVELSSHVSVVWLGLVSPELQICCTAQSSGFTLLVPVSLVLGWASKPLVPGGSLLGRHSLSTSSVPGPCEPEDLIDGIIFAANYLGSTQLLSERNPSKNIRMMQAQEAVSRVKVGCFWALRATGVGPLGGTLKWGSTVGFRSFAQHRDQAWPSISKETCSLAGECSAGHSRR